MFSPVLAILRQHASVNRACVFWLMRDETFTCQCAIFMIAPVKATIVCQCPKPLSLPQTPSEEDLVLLAPSLPWHSSDHHRVQLFLPCLSTLSTGMTFTAGKTECPTTGPVSRKMLFLISTASLPRKPTQPLLPLFFQQTASSQQGFEHRPRSGWL